MGQRYLIDTNVIIDFCNAKLPLKGQNLMFEIASEISIVTNIELFATKDITKQEFELLEQFVSISVVHPVTTDLVNNTIDIRRDYKIKLPDAIIAATALMYGLALITRNIKDFSRIQDLKIINPFEL